MIKKEVNIINKLGLHARAAAKFVSCAGEFQCEVKLARKGRAVNGKSIMGVMMLAAAKGAHLTLSADGPDEEEAVKCIERLIRQRFGEKE